LAVIRSGFVPGPAFVPGSVQPNRLYRPGYESGPRCEN